MVFGGSLKDDLQNSPLDHNMRYSASPTSTGNILSLTMFYNLFWVWMWSLVFYSFLDHITPSLLLLFSLSAIVFLLLPALALV